MLNKYNKGVYVVNLVFWITRQFKLIVIKKGLKLSINFDWI